MRGLNKSEQVVQHKALEAKQQGIPEIKFGLSGFKDLPEFFSALSMLPISNNGSSTVKFQDPFTTLAKLFASYKSDQHFKRINQELLQEQDNEASKYLKNVIGQIQSQGLKGKEDEIRDLLVEALPNKYSELEELAGEGEQKRYAAPKDYRREDNRYAVEVETENAESIRARLKVMALQEKSQTHKKELETMLRLVDEILEGEGPEHFKLPEKLTKETVDLYLTLLPKGEASKTQKFLTNVLRNLSNQFTDDAQARQEIVQKHVQSLLNLLPLKARKARREKVVALAEQNKKRELIDRARLAGGRMVGNLLESNMEEFSQQFAEFSLSLKTVVQDPFLLAQLKLDNSQKPGSAVVKLLINNILERVQKMPAKVQKDNKDTSVYQIIKEETLDQIDRVKDLGYADYEISKLYRLLKAYLLTGDKVFRKTFLDYAAPPFQITKSAPEMLELMYKPEQKPESDDDLAYKFLYRMIEAMARDVQANKIPLTDETKNKRRVYMLQQMNKLFKQDEFKTWFNDNKKNYSTNVVKAQNDLMNEYADELTKLMEVNPSLHKTLSAATDNLRRTAHYTSPAFNMVGFERKFTNYQADYASQPKEYKEQKQKAQAVLKKLLDTYKTWFDIKETCSVGSGLILRDLAAMNYIYEMVDKLEGKNLDKEAMDKFIRAEAEDFIRNYGLAEDLAAMGTAEEGLNDHRVVIRRQKNGRELIDLIDQLAKVTIYKEATIKDRLIEDFTELYKNLAEARPYSDENGSFKALMQSYQVLNKIMQFVMLRTKHYQVTMGGRDAIYLNNVLAGGMLVDRVLGYIDAEGVKDKVTVEAELREDYEKITGLSPVTAPGFGPKKDKPGLAGMLGLS